MYSGCPCRQDGGCLAAVPQRVKAHRHLAADLAWELHPSLAPNVVSSARTVVLRTWISFRVTSELDRWVVFGIRPGRAEVRGSWWDAESLVRETGRRG